MRLPIPIKDGDKRYSDIEIIRPKVGVIAETQKLVQADRYNAICNFLAGSIIEIDGITDKTIIKSLLRKMPFRSAEVAIIKIMLLLNTEDGIDGYYPCPRCGNAVIAEKKVDGESVIDTRDFISGLQITETDETEITFQLSEPSQVVNTSTGEVVSTMQSIKIAHPTLEHCMRAFQKVGGVDEMKLQLAIYVEATIEIDGRAIDNSWRNMYGMPLFWNIPNIQDLMKLKNLVDEFGIDKRVTKHCPVCGNEWRAVINTSNFFVFAVMPT